MAITQFEKYNIELEAPSQLAYAISLMHAKRESESITILKDLYNLPLYKNASLYYQGLNHILLNEKLRASEVFSQIEQTSSYSKTATEIVEKLKNEN